MTKPITTTVISGFPGIGKSYLASKFPTMARDLESSDYHWTTNEAGEKVEHPDWPANYIEAIKTLDKSGMYRVVLVSSHEKIREEMAKSGIKYTNICPMPTQYMKNEILARCVARKSHPKFLMDLDEHFFKYVRSMINDKNAVNCLQLDKNSLTKWDGWAMME